MFNFVPVHRLHLVRITARGIRALHTRTNRRLLHLTFVALVLFSTVSSFQPPAKVLADAGNVRIAVEMNDPFFHNRIFAWGLSGYNESNHYACLPACGPSAYVDTPNGVQGFSGQYNGGWWWWKIGKMVDVEVYFGPNRSRHTECWFTPQGPDGYINIIEYSIDNHGNLSCRAGGYWQGGY